MITSEERTNIPDGPHQTDTDSDSHKDKEKEKHTQLDKQRY